MPRRDPRHDVLFEPVRIGPKTLRNRFYQVPHCTGFGTRKPYAQAAHRGTKAEGGWAAVCTEYAAISPESDEAPAISVQLWDDHDAHSLALMCEAAHEHGALAGIELHHSGNHAPCGESRTPALAPSQFASDLYPFVVPKEMELADIRRIQAEWVRAARRARDVGFDIVYVYGSHSYLPVQFLSPFYNRRTDEYGGSFENRARFWIELLELVREAVGEDCAIACRIAVDALGPAGVSLPEALSFIAAADALVDLWDVNVGSIAEWSKDSGASRFFAAGYQLEWTAHVREATAKADRRRRQDDRPRPDGGDRPQRRARRDRRRSPVDRRPVPAAQDRGGPLRRGPRMHRLQRLHPQERDERPSRLHAERDRRRGAPSRLAPGGLLPRVERRP